MDNAKAKTLSFYEQAVADGLKQAYLISQAPPDGIVHNIPRILIINEGNIECSLYKDGELRRMSFGAGTALYCATNGYLYAHLPPPGCCCGSLSFYSSFIRSSGVSVQLYHTNVPISDTGQKLLLTLDWLSKKAFQHAAAINLLEALLLIAIEDIKKSKEAKEKSAFTLWRKIDLYVQEHRTEPLSRGMVAAKFNISPGHLSFLFNEFGSRDFISSLIDCRLEYASALLHNTNLSMKEVAVNSGFSHISYFIRQFKKHYGVTPHVFRNAQPLTENKG